MGENLVTDYHMLGNPTTVQALIQQINPGVINYYPTSPAPNLELQ